MYEALCVTELASHGGMGRPLAQPIWFYFLLLHEQTQHSFQPHRPPNLEIGGAQEP
jgi:hypothetical protein